MAISFCILVGEIKMINLEIKKYKCLKSRNIDDYISYFPFASTGICLGTHAMAYRLVELDVLHQLSYMCDSTGENVALDCVTEGRRSGQKERTW